MSGTPKQDREKRRLQRREEEAHWGAWMAAAQSGDSEAYETLLRAILPSIRPYVISRMRNVDQAEDVVQNVLFAIHRSRHTYRPDRPFGPWLRAVTRNATIDALRARARRESREDPLEKHEHRLCANEEIEILPESDPSLANALSQLPPAQRQAVEMLHLRELSVAEAAALLGITTGAFKVRAHRGRVALRRILGSIHEGEAST